MNDRSEISDELYEVLRQLAAGYLAHERSGHTLQPTALANEAYVRLAGSAFSANQPRTAVLAAMSTVLRQVLVDHARRRNAIKRGAGAFRQDSGVIDRLCATDSELSCEDIVAVHESLTSLEARSPRQARLVELRFFGGVSIDEAADILQQSRRTTINDWNVAKAFLRVQLLRSAGGAQQ